MVDWLLQRRANVRKLDIHDRTPLDRAALAADPRNDTAKLFPGIAKRLLERGAELTIYGAVALGDAVRVRELVRADPSVLRRIGPSGGLVTVAVNHGQIEMVRLLLDLGADVNERIMLQELEAPTESWGMPLWFAALANQRDIAELLLDRGADPNANVYASGCPLRNAWGHKDGAVKKLLLERGAMPQPYMVAEAHDVVEAKRLLEANPIEDLAKELAWSAADHGCPAIVELALPMIPWPLNDAKWHWVLIQPIRGGNSEGHFTSMAVLLGHGIDPNVARFGQTALHFAAAYRGAVNDVDRARFASMLIDHGARLDVRDDLLQSTPLGWACRWGRKKLVETLIARGASIDEPNAEPWATPQAWAEKMKHEAIFKLLSEHSG
jgi:ankyrin repeat protein